MNEPRVYQQPLFGAFFSVVWILFSCGTIWFISNLVTNVWFITPILGVFGVAFLISLLSYTSKVVITEDEITSSFLFIPQTLRWTEITRVSGGGNNIKLQNEDTTVSIPSHLPRFEEIVEIIGQKRGDLFSPQEFSEMHRGLGAYLTFFFITLLFMGSIVAFFMLIDFSSNSWLPIAFFIFFFLFFIWAFLSSPQALILENNQLHIKYLFGETSLAANDVTAVFFGYTRGRKGGKQYYIAIHSRDGKQIRVSGLDVGLPTAYLTLKNWRKKFTNS